MAYAITTELDSITRELTAYDSFAAMVTDSGREGSAYRPTMRADIDSRYAALADAYDAAQAERGSSLRAFRG